MRALNFLIQNLLNLFIMMFLLRFMLQATRADFRNPLSQFVVQVTNPLTRPVRRFVPGFRGIDLSTLLIAYLLTVAAGLLGALILSGGITNVPQLFLAALIALVYQFLYLMIFLIIAWFLFSWFAPYHPFAGVLQSLTAPMMRPFRKIIPPIANFDLSPLFALLVLQAAIMLLNDLL